MATIYKRNKRQKNELYSIQYVDHAGRRRTTQGFTDKGLSEQLAAKLEANARMRRTCRSRKRPCVHDPGTQPARPTRRR